MSLMMFKVLLAALALGLIVVAVLVVRRIANKRQLSAPEVQDEAAPQAPMLRKPTWGKKVAPPEPEDLTPAPPRRRQLQSFADAERIAAEAEAVTLPVAVAEVETDSDYPLTEYAAEAEAEVALADADTETQIAWSEPEADEPSAAPPPDFDETEYGEPDYSEQVLGRLEEAFEALQAGELTLDSYRARVLAEEAAVEERIAALGDNGGSEFEAVLAARDAVLWCLDWAEDQAEAQQG